MSEQFRPKQTAEEMQAAAKRIIAKQEKRQQEKKTRFLRKRVAKTSPSDSPTMPSWWTPEKQAYSDKVMKARELAEKREEQHIQKRKEQLKQAQQQQENRQQEKRKLETAILNVGKTPLQDNFLALASQHNLTEAMVKSLFIAMNQRPLTPKEEAWLTENLKRTTAQLPYIQNHKANEREDILIRLPEDIQWNISIQQLIQGTANYQLLTKLLNLELELRFPQFQSVLESLPYHVKELPWQLQYRLAVDWLVNKTEVLPKVTWSPFIDALIRSVQSKNSVVMKKFLDKLFDIIAQNAYLSTKEVNWTPLVAPCRKIILPKFETVCVHCQGQPWKVDKAWCAELRNGCSLPPSGKAWISAIPSLPPYRWSLLELLDFAGVTPMQMYASEGLRSNEDFQKVLGGWLNRLNKIRHLLSCRTCGSIMKPNQGYAKFLAVYPVTIFKCDYHPLPEVKITHCWLCEDVIDSRDSRFQDAGTTYNLCIKCGAGGRGHATIGRVCPKCGKGPMHLRKGSTYGSAKNLVCPSCSKSIHVTGKIEKYLAPEVTR